MLLCSICQVRMLTDKRSQDLITKWQHRRCHWSFSASAIAARPGAIRPASAFRGRHSGWQRCRQSEPACWQSAYLVLNSNADAEEAGSGCSDGSEHSGWRLLPEHAAARHSDRTPYRQHRGCVCMQLLRSAAEPVCGMEACSYKCGATRDASGKTH